MESALASEILMSMYYYEVALGVKRHWKSATFTYACEQEIAPYVLVRVPFGKQKKIGYITGVVKKPSFATKDIVTVYDYAISKETGLIPDWYRSLLWSRLCPVVVVMGNNIAAGEARVDSSQVKEGEKVIHLRTVCKADVPFPLVSADWNDFVEANQKHLEQLESVVVSDIRSFVNNNKLPMTLSFSGGKDSLACYGLAKKASEVRP